MAVNGGLTVAFRDYLSREHIKYKTIFDCVAGYVVQGSNGEYAFMRAEEKIDLVRKVRELAPKDKLVLAGSGCEGNKEFLTYSFVFLFWMLVVQVGGLDGKI